MQTPMPVVESLVRQVVEAVHPLRVILFGSAVRGSMGPGSDIDLLIVMPEGIDRDRVTHELYNRVGGVGFGYDLIVATPSVLEQYKDNCALVYKWALQEGREVYAA